MNNLAFRALRWSEPTCMPPLWYRYMLPAAHLFFLIFLLILKKTQNCCSTAFVWDCLMLPGTFTGPSTTPVVTVSHWKDSREILWQNMSLQMCLYAWDGEIITLGLVVSKEFDLMLNGNPSRFTQHLSAPSQQHTTRAQMVLAWLFADSVSYCEMFSH